MATARYFCAICRRHYLGERTVCPTDGARLVSIPEDRLQPGSVVDERFVLTDQLATGGMAAIYLAVDRHERDEVALKVLQNRYLASPRLVDLFFQEARVIRRIRHPNVVAIGEFGRSADGYLFMSMELLRGPTLLEYLWDVEPPPVDVSLRIFFQIVEALRAAHAQGVVHADLKASNVLFVNDDPDDERVKVLDFGIAKLYEPGPYRVRRADEPKVLDGTPQYMSPEQVSGEDIDPRTDLYAAGILLFLLLTGDVPFDDDDPMEVCRLQRDARPPRVSDVERSRRIPPVVDDLVERLLRKDPEERPPTAEHVYAETKEILRRMGSPTQPAVREDEDEDAPRTFRRPTVQIAAKDAEPQVRVVSDQPGADRGPDPDARQRHMTLLDIEFRGDDRPFTLLDRDTVALVTAPLVEAALTQIRNAGAIVLRRDTYHLRAAFGARSGRPADGAVAVDVALALLARVEQLDGALRIGLGVRAGVAGGPVFLHPDDRLALDLLVRGALPDIAQRLVQLAPWGGLVIDAATRDHRAERLPGARPIRVQARRKRTGVTMFTWQPTRA